MKLEELPKYVKLDNVVLEVMTHKNSLDGSNIMAGDIIVNDGCNQWAINLNSYNAIPATEQEFIDYKAKNKTV